MANPADNIVSLSELRFKPANSNDAARAVLSHHFVNVPRCSFAKDDGISHYLGSETGMTTFPALPDDSATADGDVPQITSEAPEKSGSLRRKLLRGGFGLSILLHAVIAAAVGYTTIAMPEEAMLEGITSITFVVEGDSDTNMVNAGAPEEIEAPEDKPVEPETAKPIVDVVEKPVEEPVQETPETVVKDVPVQEPGVDVPAILSTQNEAETKTEIAATQPVSEDVVEPVEKPVEAVLPITTAEQVVKPEPVVKAAKPLAHPISKPREVKKAEVKPVEEKPKPVEKKAEPRQEEPKRKPEKKEPPPEKRKVKRGDQGDQIASAKRGDVESNNKGDASVNSRGNSANREIGNAARSNYKGLVNKKLARAKGRISAPAKGKVTVTFTIMANGSVSGLTVSKSSGKDAVDRAALNIVRSAAPFPPLPAETGKKSWLMTVSMNFNGR